MDASNYRETVERVMENNRTLALSTTNGRDPWVAPVDYLRDDAGNFYFGSPTTSRHARHIEQNGTVAVAIWEPSQSKHGPDVTATLEGVQLRGAARRISEAEYPDVVLDFIEEKPGPLRPPYAVFKIEPRRVYAPIIEDGVNKRVEVEMD